MTNSGAVTCRPCVGCGCAGDEGQVCAGRSPVAAPSTDVLLDRPFVGVQSSVARLTTDQTRATDEYNGDNTDRRELTRFFCRTLFEVLVCSRCL